MDALRQKHTARGGTMYVWLASNTSLIWRALVAALTYVCHRSGMTTPPGQIPAHNGGPATVPERQ